MSTCVEVDGCCLTHSPCFVPANVGDKSLCQGWPCPKRQSWADLPGDLHSLAFENEQADVILAALAAQEAHPLLGPLLDVLRLTVDHVHALQDRIDLLPEEECSTCGAVRCCCAYDGPKDVCGLHFKPEVSP